MLRLFKDYCEVVYLERTKDISSTMLRQENSHIQRIGIIGTGRIASRFVVEAKLVSGVSTQGVYNPHTESAKSLRIDGKLTGMRTWNISTQILMWSILQHRMRHIILILKMR